MNTATLTESISIDSLSLFTALAEDACEWSGCPLWGGNVGGSKSDNGNLTDLKKKGLLYTNKEDGNEWVYFTNKGKELAKRLGITI